MKRYEAMFLVDSAACAKDFQGTRTHIHKLIERCGGEIQASDRWDERKLAFDIRGVRRGTYILTYFLAPPEKMAELNRLLELSDTVLRALIQQRDHPVEPPRREPEPEEEMEEAARFDGSRWEGGGREEGGWGRRDRDRYEPSRYEGTGH